LRTAAVAFVAAVLTGAVLTPAVRELARRWGVLDHALSSRKAHGQPVPRLGGVAIVLAFYAPLLALAFVDSEVGRRFWADSQHAQALIVGGLAIAALGVVDDLRGAKARLKFTVQFAVAGYMYWSGFRVDVIANPFGDPIHLGWLGLPFTLLWIAGVVNAMNLIDGLDGLAGGVAVIAIGSTFVLAAVRGDPMMLLFTAALAGAVLGFLFYNFNPATIFMGDTGSMFLGFVLAATAIRTNQKAGTAVAIIVPILSLGVPISDTLLSMGRRAIRGAPLFSADRGHIHHRLLARGYTPRQAVLALYGTCLVLGAAALVLSFSNSLVSALALVLVSILAFFGLKGLGFVDWKRAHGALDRRRYNIDLRLAVRRAGERLREARTPEAIWTVVQEVASAMGASAVALHFGTPGGAVGEGAWSEGFEDPAATLLQARYSLEVERPGDDWLELGWTDGRPRIDRDVEISVELLCEYVSFALDRVRSAAPPVSRSGP